ncbi:MAG TPA: hypothetical protein VG323_05380 [Thermoanaerobaculia bacterium]|nr:hypothetical protein [Thermoanaerobaculia bacterium]
MRQFWRASDGDQKELDEFIRTNFAADQTTLDALFARLEFAFESLEGHMTVIGRDLSQQSDLDLGPIYPFDEIMAGYAPGAHLNDDLFANKLAFVVLLNFPLTTLEQRLTEGDKWSRRQWAEARLAERFSKRIPAEVNLANAKAAAEAAQYVATYNIWMHHLVDDAGHRLFPPKMRLLEHWNLRDEIKADYADKTNGLAKQRTIMRVMERIIDQTIPNEVVDNPAVDWNPFTNATKPAAEQDAPGVKPEARIEGPSSRYATILKEFHAAKLVDPYSPTAPTMIERRFNEGRQIPEARVRAMFEAVLTSPLVPRVARLIEQRLSRPLEPFDLWYNGFQPQGQYTGAQLDEIVRKRYPNAEAYHADMPRIFEQLGFSPETAKFLAGNIVVDPARGSGHAFGPGMRSDHPHLRTRVGKDGMDYKGYNIAVHEMGHNVEQTFSMNRVDHYFLAGVPNTAFTEALASVPQNRDLELLGLTRPSPESRALQTLADFWDTYEKCGISLVDTEMWHWMYDHPNATAPELNAAVVQIAKDIWNRYYAPIFKKRDVTLLAVYAHMVDGRLYLPDYALGHMIAFQIEEQMERAKSIGPEFERMSRFGSVTPDLWMRNAAGAPVGPEALLKATEAALARTASAKPSS